MRIQRLPLGRDADDLDTDLGTDGLAGRRLPAERLPAVGERLQRDDLAARRFDRAFAEVCRNP